MSTTQSAPTSPPTVPSVAGPTRHRDPSTATPRVRRSPRKAAIAAVAVLSAAAVWATVDGSAGASSTADARDPDASLVESLARYADAEGLSGLSPASLSPITGCHGLSLASATGCTADELLVLYCLGASPDDDACVENRP